MDVVFLDEQDDPLPTPLEELAKVTLQAEGLPDRTQLAITLVEVARMTELNAAHMGKPGPTDVLSFPIEDFSGGFAEPGPDEPPLLLGDVVICPAVVRSNAAQAGVAFDDEIALMVVHGVLHLLGYDHVVEAEAEAMEKREREILALVGRTRP